MAKDQKLGFQSNLLGHVLDLELKRRKTMNTSYSLRSFAKYLQISPTFLSRLLKDERHVSLSMMEKIVSRLELKSEETSLLRASLVKARKERKKSISYAQLREDHIQLISGWQHYAIMALIDVEDFNPSADWIASRLNISKSSAASSFQRLVRLNILAEDADGNWTQRMGPNITTLGIPGTSSYLKKLQSQYLDLSKEALMKIPIEQRSHSSLTVAFDSALIGTVKKQIDKFRRNLHRTIRKSSLKNDSVYQLAISFFPLTGAK